MPTSGILQPGSMACARSVILKEGILEIKVSPPLASSRALDHQLYALAKADPESGHAVIGHRKLCAAVFNDVVEERNDGSSASCHVAISYDGEADILTSCISIGCDKQLVGY